MKTFLRFALAATLNLTSLFAAQQCLVIGDSLSKEYEVEFPVLYPQNREAWKARNWIEILNAQRGSWFDIGDFSAFYDPRIVGHKYNWAFPGAQTQEIRTRLASKDWFDTLWQNELKSQLKSTVERVVIFAGGNDVGSYYGSLYNGKTAATYTNKTRDNLMWMVDYVRAVRPSLQIVLVAVPHLGCTPKVQHDYPTDAVKTGKVTAALDALNTQLAALAATRGIGFATNVYAFTKGLMTTKFTIGNVEILRQADADCRARYAFSGDGFHPATATQARIAQIILDTFRTKWATPTIPMLTDTEVLQKVLKITP